MTGNSGNFEPALAGRAAAKQVVRRNAVKSIFCDAETIKEEICFLYQAACNKISEFSRHPSVLSPRQDRSRYGKIVFIIIAYCL